MTRSSTNFPIDDDDDVPACSSLMSSSSSPKSTKNVDKENNNNKYNYIPIVIQTSPEVDDMTANLIYSILLSKKNSEKNFNHHHLRPCIHLIRLSSLDTNNKKSQNGSFSSSYHLSLERKMRALTEFVASKVIFNNNNSLMMMSSNNSVVSLLSPWILILDADSQVFPGWFKKLIVKNILLPGAGVVKNNNESSSMMTMLFQREASRPKGGRRDKINTGCILMNTANPFVGALFLEANKTFEHKKGGDQTAMQRILRWYVDNPRLTVNNSSQIIMKLVTKHQDQLLLSSSLPQKKKKKKTNTDDELSQVISSFDYDVFDKRLVNAGVVDAQRDHLLIHHAHMSGQFKRENLKRTMEYKYNHQNSSVATTMSPFLSTKTKSHDFVKKICSSSTSRTESEDEHKLMIRRTCAFFVDYDEDEKEVQQLIIATNAETIESDQKRLVFDNEKLRSTVENINIISASASSSSSSSLFTLLLMVSVLALVFFMVVLKMFGGIRKK